MTSNLANKVLTATVKNLGKLGLLKPVVVEWDGFKSQTGMAWQSSKTADVQGYLYDQDDNYPSYRNRYEGLGRNSEPEVTIRVMGVNDDDRASFLTSGHIVVDGQKFDIVNYDLMNSTNHLIFTAKRKFGYNGI